MPRIFLILGLATTVVFGGLFYQYYEQQKEATQLEQYQKVLYEKTDLIYAQAKDWNKPINVDVTDARLQGDYKVMASFVLSQMIQSAEARNAYLRELKEIDWDEFWATVNGHGPCNKERLGARVKAWNDGAWVREAALAHAQKQQQRQMKEAA